MAMKGFNSGMDMKNAWFELETRLNGGRQQIMVRWRENKKVLLLKSVICYCIV